MRFPSRHLLVSLGLALAFTACKKGGGDKAKPAPTEGSSGPTAVEPPVKPHGDHNASHGGFVMMASDMHFEAVLGADGSHKVYWSDQARDALPASALEKVALIVTRPGEPAETIPLAKDPSDQFWSGKGKPLPEPTKAVVSVEFNKPGIPSSQQQIVFAATTGADHDDDHADGDHDDHGTAPMMPAPTNLADAASQIDAAQQELAAIVKDGDLSKAHQVADRLATLGATLPDLATKAGLAAPDVKALTVAGKKLKLFFNDMDEAGDAGKRDEAQQVFARYAEPLGVIKAKAK